MPDEPLKEPLSPPRERPPSEKTRAAAQRIIDALREKGAQNPVCAICGHNLWTIGAYTPIFVTPNVNQPSLGGPSYPFVALICVTCGNTHFINLMQLGFKQGELDGLAFEELPGG
jgi:hypothetical protein